MSELKRHHINEVMDMHNLTRGEMSYSFVYYADDVDRVIAEKDKEIARLNDKALQYKVLDKEHCRDLNTQERLFALQMAYHKYKRCLAMARMCEERSARYDVLQERHDLDWGREIEFYYRWYQRWLELAEKFKPNNSTAQ